jgi:hypothetical protein
VSVEQAVEQFLDPQKILPAHPNEVSARRRQEHHHCKREIFTLGAYRAFTQTHFLTQTRKDFAEAREPMLTVRIALINQSTTIEHSFSQIQRNTTAKLQAIDLSPLAFRIVLGSRESIITRSFSEIQRNTKVMSKGKAISPLAVRIVEE